MHEDKQIDGRDLRNGGWFWGQRELLHVFTPLIGPEASWLYMVLCDLIPEKAKNPQLELTIRWMQRASGLSVGTVHRKLAVLIAIGMVEEEKRGNRRASLFKLVDLRKLASVGDAEMKRRMAVPPGNSGDSPSAPETSADDAATAPQPPATGASAKVSATLAELYRATAPAASGERAVPPGNTEGGRDLARGGGPRGFLST